MENIIFINQKGLGYSYTSFPYTNDHNPINQELFAQELPRIHVFCELRPNTFSVVFFKKGTKILFFYGIFLPEFQDDKNRKGIHFAHCLILSKREDLLPVILCLLKLFESEGREELYFLLNTIANQDAFKKKELEDFLTSTFRINSTVRPVKIFKSNTNTTKIKKVIHNVGGLSAYVWLILAEIKSQDLGDWAVYEKVEKNKIITETSDEGSEINASDLFLTNQSAMPMKSDYLRSDFSEELIIELNQIIKKLEGFTQRNEHPDDKLLDKTKEGSTDDNAFLGWVHEEYLKQNKKDERRRFYFFLLILIVSFVIFLVNNLFVSFKKS